MKKASSLSVGAVNAAIGVLFLLFFLSLGLAIALYVRPLYYLGIGRISEETGYSPEEIRENYDALIDWCSPFSRGELSFPTLPASASGLKHFREVKTIFNLFFALLFVTPALLAVLITVQERRHSHSYLYVSPIIVCVLPLLVAAASAVDFDRVFVLFHKIVFRNDDWMFSVREDPIILFLPERFFLQCALVIVGTVLLGCLTLLVLWFTRRAARAPRQRQTPKRGRA